MRIRSFLINLLPKNKNKSPTLNLVCTEFEVDCWIISEFILKELIPIVGIRPYPLQEQMLMVATIVRLKPTHIFEWGTHYGKSARIFYETVKHFRIKAKIHSTDLPDNIEHIEHPKNKRAIFLKGIAEVKFHLGDGLDKSLQIYKKIKNPAKIKPLFFLDGDHEYTSVKRELEGIIKNVKNPIILVHDTFYQSEESGYNIGPYKAVQEIITKNPKRFKVLVNNYGLPGMTLLYNL